ncbi:MAG: YIP1 family protein [bacterium]
MLNIITDIVIHPKKCWEKVTTTDYTKIELFLYYVVPFALFAAVMSVIRLTLIGVKHNFNNIKKADFLPGLAFGAMEFVLLVFGVWITIILINATLEAFKFRFPSILTYKLIIISIIPAFLGEIFLLFPAISFVSIIIYGYSILIIYFGMKKMFKYLEEKLLSMFFIVVIILIFIFKFIFGILNTMFINSLK